MTLLHLSQTSALSKVVVDGLRASALILESINKDKAASQVAETIAELLQPTTEQLTTTLTDLQITTDSLRSSAVSITRTVDEFSENTASSLQYLTDAAGDVNTAAEEIQEAIKAKPQGPNPTPTPPTNSLSYATAVATGAHLTPAHVSTLARGDARSHQVLVDKAPGATSNGLENLTEKELVEKARIATDQLAQTDEHLNTPIQFIGARKLRNGGVIYEMGTAEAAHWLQSSTNMTNFLQVFSTTFVIKQRTHPLVVEYIPLTFKPDDQNHLGEIERENRLETKGILNARWIKPTYQRTQGQRVAHAILGLTNPEEANGIIRNGLVIAGKRVWARKLRQEPRRCLKCQQLGTTHLAAECKQTHNMCGTCSEDHRTADCTVTDPINYSCANCKEKGV